MNYGLVQSAMLYALIGLTIPYIIHLIFRQKPRDVSIGSIRFVRHVVETSRNRRKVMRWLLLTLRMACVALLVIVFARPFVVEKDLDQRDERLLVVLIDRSASMQLQTDGRRLVDIAVDQAKKVIEEADEPTRIEVTWFDRDVEPLALGDGDRKTLVSQISAPEDMYAETNFATAFRWAHDVCAAAKLKQQELHVFTDLQQAGMAWSDVDPMPSDVKVRVHDVGRDLPNNLAVTHAQPASLAVRPGEPTTVEVTVLNDGPFTLDAIPVTLRLKNGSRTIRQREKIKLQPASLETIVYDLPELDIGLWQGSVVLEAIDDISFDNQRHVAIMSTLQYRVLVIDGDPHPVEYLSETYLLQTALRLARTGQTSAQSNYVPLPGSLTDVSGDYAAVVLANVETIEQHDATRLKEFVNQGGGLVVFSGDQVTADGYQALSDQGLVPGEIVSARESFQLPWRIDSWDKSHSVFEPFNDPQHGDLRQLAFRGITEMIPDHDAVALATFNDGKPFVIEKVIGDLGGRVLWITTSCDNQWGQWGQSELFLPIVHQVMGHVTGLNDGGPVREAAFGIMASASKPGVFPKGQFWQVVNTSPRESELDRCTVAEFIDRFGLNITADESPTVQTASLGSALSVRKDELWPWMLFALLVVVSAEYFLANRTVA